MKIETVSMLSSESRDRKYAYVWKRKLQVGLAMKVEIASLLNIENRTCKYAKISKEKLQVCLTMKIEITSMLCDENGNYNMLIYENRNWRYA